MQLTMSSCQSDKPVLETVSPASRPSRPEAVLGARRTGATVETVSFGRRLAGALQQHGPLCVGVDPSPALLKAWGLTYDEDGLDAFGTIMIDAMSGQVAVLKPQVGFWEAHGAAGYAALERFIALARKGGFLIVADAKRGDIGSTSEAYARAWLHPDSPLCVDAVTVTAYLGLGAMNPFLEAASEHGHGVIVVARSSNPEGTVVQSAMTDSGTDVADHLLTQIAAVNARDQDAPHGSIGAVIGGTTKPGGFDITRLGGPILAPGFGAQGATAADYRRLYGGCPPGSVLASVSRDILRAGPDPAQLALAAQTWQRDLNDAADRQV